MYHHHLPTTHSRSSVSVTVHSYVFNNDYNSQVDTLGYLRRTRSVTLRLESVHETWTTQTSSLAWTPQHHASLQTYQTSRTGWNTGPSANVSANHGTCSYTLTRIAIWLTYLPQPYMLIAFGISLQSAVARFCGGRIHDPHPDNQDIDLDHSYHWGHPRSVRAPTRYHLRGQHSKLSRTVWPNYLLFSRQVQRLFVKCGNTLFDLLHVNVYVRPCECVQHALIPFAMNLLNYICDCRKKVMFMTFKLDKHAYYVQYMYDVFAHPNTSQYNILTSHAFKTSYWIWSHISVCTDFLLLRFHDITFVIVSNWLSGQVSMVDTITRTVLDKLMGQAHAQTFFELACKRAGEGNPSLRVNLPPLPE